MKVPTRKEVVVDIAWLILRFVASSIYYFICTPLFSFYAAMYLLLVIAGFLMSATEKLCIKIDLFNDTPVGYFKRTVKSIKVSVNYSNIIKNQCPSCGSFDTILKSKNMRSVMDYRLSYKQEFIHCKGCHFDFVNSETEATTLKNREVAQKDLKDEREK